MVGMGIKARDLCVPSCLLVLLVSLPVSHPSQDLQQADVLRAVSTGLKGRHVNFGTSGISDMDPGGGDSGEVGCGNDVEDAMSERKKGKDPHWLELRSMGEAGMAALEAYVKDLFAMGDGWGYADIKVAKKRMDKARHVLSKKHKMVPPVSAILRTYDQLITRGILANNLALRSLLVRKSVRSWSGVLVVTIFTSPGQFSCPRDCYYCPNEVDENGTSTQPRSYLSTEPGCRRALANDFDCVRQFRDRVGCLKSIGHKVDKIEVLVLGGTWSYYPVAYQEEFMRDTYYAANTLDSGNETLRPRMSLREEQEENENARYKIIGITLETRPDFITKPELKRFRRYGCTRVQVGLQHTDDSVLLKINRECTNEQGKRAIKLLKESCFKVDVHLMPDLPGSNPEMDRKMLGDALFDPDLDADYYKIYPTSVTPYTKIEEWYRAGLYKPYADEDNGEKLIEVLIWFKERVQVWKRINRIPRDIPNQSIIAGNKVTNLRQILLQKMAKRGLRCKCIRCREVKDSVVDLENAELKERQHEASGGLEMFLSFETPDELTLLGFLRLRFNEDPDSNIFPELRGAALIRELHVYGKLVATYEENGREARPQHGGLGRRLVARAEELSAENGFSKIAIISGVGVRQYYRKLGYQLEGDGQFMVKDLTSLPEEGARESDVPLKDGEDWDEVLCT